MDKKGQDAHKAARMIRKSLEDNFFNYIEESFAEYLELCEKKGLAEYIKSEYYTCAYPNKGNFLPGTCFAKFIGVKGLSEGLALLEEQWHQEAKYCGFSVDEEKLWLAKVSDFLLDYMGPIVDEMHKLLEMVGRFPDVNSSSFKFSPRNPSPPDGDNDEKYDSDASSYEGGGEVLTSN